MYARAGAFNCSGIPLVKGECSDMSLIPYVIEQASRGERSYDIIPDCSKERIIFLGGEVNDVTRASVVGQLLPGI